MLIPLFWKTRLFKYFFEMGFKDEYSREYIPTPKRRKISNSGNMPWSFVGPIGLWHDSTVGGMVRITGCALIALRNDDSQWEPYDTSESARAMFPFNPENQWKHHVPTDTLHILAKSWTRMYAWFLEDPVKLEPCVKLHIRKGAQKIQNMDEDSWAVAWHDFEKIHAEKPQPSPRCLPPTLMVLGMGYKHAFQFLEGDANLLLKTYKPDKLGLIHVAVTHGGTAFIVGSFVLTSIRVLRNISSLRKLESEGYHYDPLQGGKQVKSLEASKEVQAWMIYKRQLLEPPLTWKTDSRTMTVFFAFQRV